MKKKISEYLKQENNILYALKKCKLILDLEHYEDDDVLSINEEENNIWVKSLVSTIIFEDITFNLILDYAISINIINGYKKVNNKIEVNYDINDHIIQTTLEFSNIQQQAIFVERLVGGREILHGKDPNHLYRRLLKVYSELGKMDSVHLEVLASQALRDRKNINLPARLGKEWDPVLVNLKKVIFSEGFIQGLAFENIGEAVRSGLISKVDKEPSVLEKIVTGTLIEEKKGY